MRFAHGTTSGILDDSLAAGATRAYLVGARQGQVMLAHAIAWPVAERLHPPPEPAVRVFATATGRELPSPRAEPEVWSARLPEDGDYVVRVTAGAQTTYTLAVQIPRQVQVSADQPTAIFTGSTPSRAPIDYLIRAEAGRTLEVVLGGAPSRGAPCLRPDDGTQLARLADRQRLYAGRVRHAGLRRERRAGRGARAVRSAHHAALAAAAGTHLPSLPPTTGSTSPVM